MGAAGREGQRASGQEADEPALGIEQVEERSEVALVGAASVEEDERAGGSGRRRAGDVLENATQPRPLPCLPLPPCLPFPFPLPLALPLPLPG